MIGKHQLWGMQAILLPQLGLRLSSIPVRSRQLSLSRGLLAD